MKVLMVFAHPDDEIIFGWPIFQDPTIEKELIMVTSDFNIQPDNNTHIESFYYKRFVKNIMFH